MAKTLPNKPSKLIRVAVADLRQVERMKSYEVDMRVFHSGGEKGPNGNPCAVCFAGSVIARTLKAPMENHASPIDFNAETRSKLHALDTLRGGDITSYLYTGFHKRLPAGITMEANIPEYEDDPDGFKRKMLDVAKFLEAINL